MCSLMFNHLHGVVAISHFCLVLEVVEDVDNDRQDDADEQVHHEQSEEGDGGVVEQLQCHVHER